MDAAASVGGRYVSDGYFADSYYFRKVDGVLYLYFQPDRQYAQTRAELSATLALH